MFGTWISQIQADLRKQFPATKDYRPVDFQREPMPVSVGHFLEHALTRRAAMIQVSVDPNWFDLSNQDVIESEIKWREALAASSRYPEALWGQSIDQAVAHVVAFLVSPSDSFCDFAFANATGAVHPKVILQRLVYFKPYSRLREVIKAWAEKKGSEPISKEDLRAMIIQADRAIVADYEPSDWIALLRPLYDLAMVMGPAVPEVPTSLLKPVFEAKAADDLVHRIEAIESIGGRRRLTESDLLTVIGPTEPAPAAIPVVEPSSETAGALPDEAAAENRPLQLNDIHAKPVEKALPRWMQFTSAVEPSPGVHSGDGGGGEASAEVQPVRATPSVAQIEAETQAVPVQTETKSTMQFEPEVSVAQAETQVAVEQIEDMGIPLPSRVGQRALLPDDYATSDTSFGDSTYPVMPEYDGLSDINPVQRAWFVNSLFGGDAQDFSRVMSLIDRADDWEAAAHVIGAEVFKRYEVDIYSQPAIEFTNVVESRYQ